MNKTVQLGKKETDKGNAVVSLNEISLIQLKSLQLSTIQSEKSVTFWTLLPNHKVSASPVSD